MVIAARQLLAHFAPVRQRPRSLRSGHGPNCRIQDTGPGFKGASATPLARILKEATTEAREVEDQASLSQTSVRVGAAPTLPSESFNHTPVLPSGEGIGLSIVKRLCELLDASLGLETGAGEGTTFRVILPRSYREETGE